MIIATGEIQIIKLMIQLQILLILMKLRDISSVIPAKIIINYIQWMEYAKSQAIVNNLMNIMIKHLHNATNVQYFKLIAMRLIFFTLFFFTEIS